MKTLACVVVECIRHEAVNKDHLQMQPAVQSVSVCAYASSLLKSKPLKKTY